MRSFVLDVEELRHAAAVGPHPLAAARVLVATDSWVVLALHRVRSAALCHHIPLVAWVVRRAMTALYGMEVGAKVTLGPGVHFVHTPGVIVGGTSQVGARVRFYGNNTVGTARDDGYPVIEEDVRVGCGARVLGPVRVGARSVIAANAVVLRDVPPDSVVAGAPARVVGSARVGRTGGLS